MSNGSCVWGWQMADDLSFENDDEPVSEVIETHVFRIWMGKDGISRAHIILPGAELTLEDIQTGITSLSKITQGKRVPRLSDIRNIKSMTREARVYSAGEEPTRLTTALGVITHSPLSKMIGNLFMGLNKPTYPTRLFTDESQAIAWLKQFL